MNVKSLILNHFRNYEKQELAFSEGINILFGQNAQGKTNVLEALYIASTGKSHRTNNYQDLVQTGCSGFEIELVSQIKDRENRVLIRYNKNKGRCVEVNGIKRERLSDILGTLNMILFSPETLEVVKGSPQERRKFIDILLCQTNRQYLYCLQQYNLVLKNKSIAIKKGKQNNKYQDVLPVWNESLAQYGGKISCLRKQAILKLNSFMKNEIQKITEGKETSELIYKTYCEDSHLEYEYYEECLKQKLQAGIQKEINLSQCLYGPHRDDIEILLNGMNSRIYCSQGQQRTLALSLILAELFYIEEVRGEKPVLLLDDVMSELDLKRQEYLVNGLHEVQTFITTTDDVPYQSIMNRSVSRFLIESGSVMLKS